MAERKEGLEQLVVRAEGLAALLDVSRPMAYRLLQHGVIPSVLIRGCRRILVADVEQYLADLKDKQSAPSAA